MMKKIDRLKQARKLSQTFQLLLNSFTDCFESELRKFEATATKTSGTSMADGFKQHIKNMFNKFSSYWFTYIYIYIYMNPITLSTRNIYYFKRTYKCMDIYIISSDK